MEERTTTAGATERPAERPPTGSATDASMAPGLGPPHLADPRALTILTTEHWSLLTARSLVYNEAFARAGMFLTFLTGSLVALGFVSQGMGFGREFLIITAVLLAFDLFLGLATLGRISAASSEEFRAMQGMNRLRHAYLEMVPSLERYFSTPRHDDFASILSIYGGPIGDVAVPSRPPSFIDLAHGFTTKPGMVATICAAIAGGLGATLALLLGAGPAAAIAIGILTLLAVTAALAILAGRVVRGADRRYEVRFPPPDA
jgi:hypothetical protein